MPCMAKVDQLISQIPPEQLPDLTVFEPENMVQRVAEYAATHEGRMPKGWFEVNEHYIPPVELVQRGEGEGRLLNGFRRHLRARRANSYLAHENAARAEQANINYIAQHQDIAGAQAPHEKRLREHEAKMRSLWEKLRPVAIPKPKPQQPARESTGEEPPTRHDDLVGASR